MNKKLIIFGTSSFGEIAKLYFERYTSYKVVAFTVTKEFITDRTIYNTPIVDFDTVEKIYPSDEHDMFIALVYNNLNTTRERFFNEAKLKGYSLPTFIHPEVITWPNLSIGENNFIFEGNNLQPGVNLGDNNIIWSTNHIGHHSLIGNNNFISTGVIISGHTRIGNNNFFGVNSSFGNNIFLGSYNLFGAGINRVKGCDDYNIVKGPNTKEIQLTTKEIYNLNL